MDGSLKISTSETDDLDELITAVQNSDAQALRVLSLLPSGTKLFKGVPQSAATDNGCHENYEAIVAEGKLLRVYRILIRTALCTQLLAKTVTAVCVSLLFGCQWLVSRRKPCSLSEATFEDFRSVPGILKSPLLLTVRYSHAPTVFLIRYIGMWVAFRKQRRYLIRLRRVTPVRVRPNRCSEIFDVIGVPRSQHDVITRALQGTRERRADTASSTNDKSICRHSPSLCKRFR